MAGSAAVEAETAAQVGKLYFIFC